MAAYANSEQFRTQGFMLIHKRRDCFTKRIQAWPRQTVMYGLTNQNTVEHSCGNAGRRGQSRPRRHYSLCSRTQGTTGKALLCIRCSMCCLPALDNEETLKIRSWTQTLTLYVSLLHHLTHQSKTGEMKHGWMWLKGAQARYGEKARRPFSVMPLSMLWY